MNVSPPARRERILAMACISLSAACLVGGYEFVRSTAASLFMEAFGSGAMPYAMTVAPVLMFALIYAYGKVLSRLGPRRTLMTSLAFAACVLVLCHAALRTGAKSAVAVLYVFGEVYIVILVEQFWAFINSSLESSEARAFNGPILGGASLGPILAGFLLKSLAVRLGSETFVLLSGLSLLPTAALAWAAYRLAGEPKPDEAEAREPSALHLGVIREHRILLFIAALVTLSQVFSTVTNLRLYGLLEVEIPLKDARSAYLGSFWAWANGLAFAMQFAVTPLILRRLPLRATLLGIPAIHLLTAAFMLLHPSLGAAAFSLLVFKGIDYSAFRASKELLYIPLPFDARYRAKQVVDAFNYRCSKGVTAGLISLAKSLCGTLPAWAFPAAALAAAAAWLAAAVPLAREAEREKA
ncbi:MAG: hypothetical protein WC969_03555 [Elusimicrobiota bacterium]|jgi:ATP/ADP translocase